MLPWYPWSRAILGHGTVPPLIGAGGGVALPGRSKWPGAAKVARSAPELCTGRIGRTRRAAARPTNLDAATLRSFVGLDFAAYSRRPRRRYDVGSPRPISRGSGFEQHLWGNPAGRRGHARPPAIRYRAQRRSTAPPSGRRGRHPRTFVCTRVVRQGFDGEVWGRHDEILPCRSSWRVPMWNTGAE
jgi:hypothetical protein